METASQEGEGLLMVILVVGSKGNDLSSVRAFSFATPRINKGCDEKGGGGDPFSVDGHLVWVKVS